MAVAGMAVAMVAVVIGFGCVCLLSLPWKGPAGGQPRYKGSHCGVVILTPVPKPQVGSFAEHTVPNGAAIAKGDDRAASSISSSLESLAAQLALCRESSLAGGQIEQPLCPMAANDGRLAQGDLGNGHSHHGGDAGAGQTVRAGHDLRVLWRLLSPPCLNYRPSGGGCRSPRPDL